MQSTESVCQEDSRQFKELLRWWYPCN